MGLKYPETKKVEKVDDYHGTKISDPYQWLENYNDDEVQSWISEQEKLSNSIIGELPQKKIVEKRLNELRRYDEKTEPMEVVKGKRIFFYESKKEDEKWIYYTREDENSEKVELINPNKWGEEESLSFCRPSADGKYIAFGKDKAGGENSQIHVMEVKSKKILKESASGRIHSNVSWVHDNSGFFYSRKPLKGDVPEGEENYWNEVYFHKLGEDPSKDKKVFFHESKKEYFHSGHVTEDGKYVIFSRNAFGKNEVYFMRIGTEEIRAIAEGFDAFYEVDIIEDKIIIDTNQEASNGRVLVTEVDNPQKENWRELIPETEDNLCGVNAIEGNLYLEYLHKAYSKIKIYSLEGEYIRDLKLPGVGSAEIYGYYSKPGVWLRFSSFLFPLAMYKYDFNKNRLELFFKPPIDIDTKKFVTEQVDYESKDGTKISMFLLRRKDMEKNGANPVFLTGYGGFGISTTPGFSGSYMVWLEHGGIVAIPNLRGGGEYGKEWHEAGKLEKKQNVFDDFIYSAKFLIENKYTNPEKIAISGGSNGGLLVGAAVVQAPELFRAACCAVPLLDMLRYHKFGFANVWVVEYGSSDDPEQFKYIHRYSPYHNVKDGVKYPSILITTSENDSRVHTMHALKMTARLQEANPSGNEVLLLVEKDSGHTGGTTISQNIKHTSKEIAFLMDKVGIK